MFVRRSAAAGVAGLLALGLGLQPAVPAEAAAGDALLNAWDGASYGGGCSAPVLTGTEPFEVPFPVDGAWHSTRLDRSGTVGNSSVRGTGTAAGRAVAYSNGSARIDLRLGAAVQATPQGPSCDPIGYDVNVSAAVVDLAVTRASWLVARSRGTARGVFTSQIGGGTMDFETEIFVPVGQRTVRLLPPGSYYIGGGTETRVEVPKGSTAAQSASSTASAEIAVHPIGTRKVHAGKARRWVKVGSRSCARNKVRATLTRKARRDLRQLTLYVGRKKRAVLTGRELRRKGVTLKRIKPASYGRIRAVAVTRSGAKRSMRSTSWPCR